MRFQGFVLDRIYGIWRREAVEKMNKRFINIVKSLLTSRNAELTFMVSRKKRLLSRVNPGRVRTIAIDAPFPFIEVELQPVKQKKRR